MRLHNKKTVVNYAPESNPPKSEKNKISISLYIYLVLVVIFVLYIFYTLYTKISYVKITGFIKVPKVVVKAYRFEVVDKIFVKRGAIVRVGQPLFLAGDQFETKLPTTVRVNLKIQLENLKIKLKTVQVSLSHINSPEITKIDSQIESVKAQISSRENQLKTINNFIRTYWTAEKNKRLLELSPLSPDALENTKLNILRLKNSITLSKAFLKILKKERRGLVRLTTNDLLAKEKLLKKNITILENELKNLNSQVFKTRISNVIRSQLNGKVVEINVYPHQSVRKGDSFAVIVPDTVKIKIMLVSGAEKIRYLKKGLELKLKLPDGMVLYGKIVDVRSAALKYQPKLTENYWPIPSPVVSVVELKNPPKNLISLDGVKIQAIIRRKIWNIF